MPRARFPWPLSEDAGHGLRRLRLLPPAPEGAGFGSRGCDRLRSRPGTGVSAAAVPAHGADRNQCRSEPCIHRRRPKSPPLPSAGPADRGRWVRCPATGMPPLIISIRGWMTPWKTLPKRRLRDRARGLGPIPLRPMLGVRGRFRIRPAFSRRVQPPPVAPRSNQRAFETDPDALPKVRARPVRPKAFRVRCRFRRSFCGPAPKARKQWDASFPDLRIKRFPTAARRRLPGPVRPEGLATASAVAEAAVSVSFPEGSEGVVRHAVAGTPVRAPEGT
jgi:hypothetical protein